MKIKIIILTCILLILASVATLAVATNTGTSSPSIPESSSDTSSETSSGTSSETSSEASSGTSSSSSDTSSSDENSSVPEITYTDLLPNSESYTIKIGSRWQLTFPEQLAANLVTASALQEQVQQYISDNEKPENITQATWQAAMQGKGYFAAYPDTGVWISDKFLMRVSVFPDSPETDQLFSTIRNSTTGDVVSFMFGDFFTSLLYATSGIDSMTRLGDTDNESEDLQSFVFQAKTQDTQIAQGYYGYFILAHDKINKQYAVIILSGVDNLFTPDELQSIYETFTHIDDKNNSYWFEFKP